MPAVRIDALCACEGCDKRFGVELELAADLKEDGSFSDFESMVRDTILGGQANCYTWGVRGKATVDRLSLDRHPTIQGGYMLCDICTKKCDDLPIEGDLTKKQVEKTLGLRDTSDDPL